MILYLIIGILIGIFLGVVMILSYQSTKKVVPEYISGRRGVYFKKMMPITMTIEVQFEVEAIDSTPSLTKIKVISCSVPGNMSYSSYRQGMINVIDNSWVKTSEIEWVTNTQDIREQKLNSILK